MLWGGEPLAAYGPAPRVRALADGQLRMELIELGCYCLTHVIVLAPRGGKG